MMALNVDEGDRTLFCLRSKVPVSIRVGGRSSTNTLALPHVLDDDVANQSFLDESVCAQGKDAAV